MLFIYLFLAALGFSLLHMGFISSCGTMPGHRVNEKVKVIPIGSKDSKVSSSDLHDRKYFAQPTHLQSINL